MSGLVIIGASYGGIQAALSARDAGYAEPVTIVADEKSLPYQRPPLSKDFLLGETSEQNLVLRDDAVFHYKQERLIAVDSINRPGDQMAARRLIAAGISPSPGQAADSSFDIKSLLKMIDKAVA